MGTITMMIIMPILMATATEAVRAFNTPERREHGYVIVLTGVEGRSSFNKNIARGLGEATPFAIERYDWTAGPFLMLWNLRGRRRQDRQIACIREKIERYQTEFPDRPVYLIGHSGGGAMALRVLASLDRPIAGAVLLAAAISPRHALGPLMKRVECGIWSFRSWGDFVILGLLTTICGTLDGDHIPAAGVCGFTRSAQTGIDCESAQPVFVDIPWRIGMARYGYFGGHFGCTTRSFIRHWVAPILMGDSPLCRRTATPANATAAP